MWWLLLAVGSALALACSNLIDKHVLSGKLRDARVASTVSGFTLFLFFTLSAFWMPTLPISLALAPLLAGACYNLALLTYFRAAEREDISRMVPILKLDILFILLLSFFLGQTLSWFQVMGVVSVLVGAVCLTWTKGRLRASPFTLLAVFFFTSRTLFLSLSTPAGLPWVGLGGLLVGIVLLLFHHPHLRKTTWKGVEHLVLSNMCAALYLFLFSLALASGPLPLVNAASATVVLWVFAFSLLLGRQQRKQETRFLSRKAIGIVLMFFGLVLMSIYL